MLFAIGALVLASGMSAQTSAVPSHAAAGDVLNLLETHCVRCHGGEKTKSGLDLSTREMLLRGGESGAAFSPGESVETSLFYQMIAHLEEPGMPHKEDMLPAPAIEQIADWLRAGAPYPRALNTQPGNAKPQPDFVITPADREHWGFQPVHRPEVPAVKNSAWPKNPIDRFILAAQEANSLQPSSPASRKTLIRRVTFDLIGLPPTPAEVEAFARDSSPNAYEKLLDRLLASPHYGERWGRHWLDLARFAESDGFEHDAVRPNAWRYRDYVIRAFNSDKPYDRFILEQIAGDELFPGDSEALTATAFNLLGPDMVDSADQIQRRRNTLNDMTDTTALAFLGMTIGCARCHDHKFEPISHRDYYAFQAFFAPAKFRHDAPVAAVHEREAHEAALREYNEQTGALQAAIAELEAPVRQVLYEGKLAKLSAEAQAAHRTPKDKRTTEQENQIQETAGLLTVRPRELVAAMTKADRNRHKQLQEELAPFPKPKPLPATLALQTGPPVKTHVLHRGDYSQPLEEVAPAVPEVLRETGAAIPPAASPATARAALAQWIANPVHPLTARVMVNRIWQHHFGRGLVPTPSDFGTHGQKPTHPELLDWLASEFVARGWSVKRMHKLMLLSATYQQASRIDNLDTRVETATARDPENRLYWRMNRQRLEGEAIRDSLLAISGELNPKSGGPGVFPPIPKELFAGAKGWTPSVNPRDHARRSVYIFARRNLRFPFLEVFDAPDNNLSCPNRESSTTAPQSLTLLNAEEVLSAAARTAEQIEREAESSDARIDQAYCLILGRGPTEKERTLSREFLAQSPLEELCRALFNLNAFVYVD